MKNAFALILALLLAAPAGAFEELFGYRAGDLIAEAHRQRAEYELRLARERASKARGSWLGELLGTIAVPRQKAECVFAAVARRLGADPAARRMPAVYYASRTILEDYLAYYYAERGIESGPDKISTSYFPRNNALFLDDSGKQYGGGRTIDDATAGQFALAVLSQGGQPPDQASAAASETERWFNAAYTVPKKSACP